MAFYSHPKNLKKYQITDDFLINIRKTFSLNYFWTIYYAQWI